MADVSGLYILKSTDNFFMVHVEAESDGSERIHVVPATFNNQENFRALLDESIRTLPLGRHCLEIVSSETSDRPILNNLEYFQNCSMGDTMDKKTGTYNMVCATISFCAEIFGEKYTKFGVHDAATFWCEKKQVNLWLHNLLVYGDTYYERKFGAKPDESNEATAEKIAGWTSTKKKLATEPVTRDLVDPLIRQTRSDLGDNHLGNDLCAIMENCVGNCTWNKMFHDLHFAHDGKGCQFFSRDSLRRIQGYFKIVRIDKFQIEISTKHKESLLAHEKILDGQETALVTLEEIEKHRENKN